MNDFLLCFIPLFIAVDAIGILPLFIGLTEGIDARRRRLAVIQSVITALVGGLLFLLCGKWVLNALGISIADFMIAGGTGRGDFLCDPVPDEASALRVPIGVC